MYVPCWNCGQDIWIKTQTECRHCGKAAKRCVDCVRYAAGTGMCAARSVQISSHEASAPSPLSQSYRCLDYQQSPTAATEATRKREAPAAKPAPAAAARRPREAATRPVQRAAQPARQRVGGKRPHVIAHRGSSLHAPENTLAAIKSAAALGVDSIEFDVHVTSDGVPVVIHDSTVDRTTNGSGRVSEMTFAEIRELDAGSWFAESFTGEHVPSLTEAVEAAGGAFVNAHVKCHENHCDRAEKGVVEALREADVVDRCWITHHTRHGLYRLKELEPKLRLCWLPRGGGQDIEYIDEAFYMAYRIIQPTFRAVTPEFVDYAHGKQMWINAFWADEEDLMRRLTEMGVDGILTNVPDKLQRVIGARQPRAASES